MPNIAGPVLESNIASVLEDFPLTEEIVKLKKTQAELQHCSLKTRSP